MRRFLLIAIISLASLPCIPALAAPPTVDQGPAWTLATRARFYSQDQGSQIMPLRWIMALKQPSGAPFLADKLTRYGYLSNDEAPTSILPVGFTSAGPLGGEVIGMTCAACHTRQIEVKGAAYRIDGGPAIADFQSFLIDLDTAVNAVISDATAFQEFAAAVLSQPAPPAAEAQLMADLKAWYLRYHTLTQRALPTPPWGPSRLDAVSMIFNRLTGLDIGPPPSFLIAGNIKPADAPVRYPFLWNAAIQDKTQWPGFADNGNGLLGLARNLGEVIGVFGTFHPAKDPDHPFLKIDYLTGNSANFDGLDALEHLIRQIGPPKFPWPIDPALAKQGEAIFARTTAQGGCADCHAITPGKTQLIDQKTWATPLMDVGTDSREYDVLARKVSTGVLNGARIPLIFPALNPSDTAFRTLSTAVVGSILEKLVPLTVAVPTTSRRGTGATDLAASALAATPEGQQLKGAFTVPPPATFKYEARVLQGIWATAPYLHNGSVPTLTDLLKPASERPASFKIGPAYDPVAVGLDPVQTRFDATLNTTDCTNRNSGNSRCGHEFGTTTLTPQEKRALLEYLKQL
jgi:mono/diheme cytochrome c family protein